MVTGDVRLGSQGLVSRGLGTTVAVLGAVDISSSSLGWIRRRFRAEHTAIAEFGQAGRPAIHRAITDVNRRAFRNGPGLQISRAIHDTVSRSAAPSGRT